MCVGTESERGGLKLIHRWFASESADKVVTQANWPSLMCSYTNQAGIVELATLTKAAVDTQLILPLLVNVCEGKATQGCTALFGMCKSQEETTAD